MKKLIKAVLIVAIINLLAVGGLVGYLASKGRLTKDRLLDITSVVQETPEDREARLEAERLAALPDDTPEPVAEGDIQNTDRRNDARVEITLVDRERLERLQREVQDLQTQLRRQRQMLERERAQFEQEKMDFRALRDRLTEIEGGQAFQDALAVLNNMKPADVKTVLTTMLGENRAEEVVSYLAAFGERHRAKVISEFVKANEEQVAADLLESLRTRGLEPAQAGVTPP